METAVKEKSGKKSKNGAIENFSHYDVTMVLSPLKTVAGIKMSVFSQNDVVFHSFFLLYLQYFSK